MQASLSDSWAVSNTVRSSASLFRERRRQYKQVAAVSAHPAAGSSCKFSKRIPTTTVQQADELQQSSNLAELKNAADGGPELS